ncbi:MAG: hypothetical protein CL699_00650 [Chloroflexi bacterium]|nr:MAG: bifunctional nuclease family protein [SAR202 cluster bacterium]MAO74814.1 hypothetical protein [Chloroflexota bacterium]MBA14670.1 hypothetical protein [Chloroflexota bacterium]
MIELEIESIRVRQETQQRAVVLKVKGSDTYLPIFIGPFEVESIRLKLMDVKVERPLTHDLLTSVISDMGGQIESVIVSELKNDTFYAKILISSGDNLIEIDSRPSDAIAVAIRSDVPIFVEDDVVTKAGVVFEGQEEFETEDGLPQKPIDDQELESLSVFSEFIDSLDLGDLGDQ